MLRRLLAAINRRLNVVETDPAANDYYAWADARLDEMALQARLGVVVEDHGLPLISWGLAGDAQYGESSLPDMPLAIDFDPDAPRSLLSTRESFAYDPADGGPWRGPTAEQWVRHVSPWPVPWIGR